MQVTADQLKAIVERYERLEAEKRDIADAQKDVLAEAKGNGYCIPTLRRIMSLRKKSKDERDNAEAIEKMYKDALGM